MTAKWTRLLAMIALGASLAFVAGCAKKAVQQPPTPPPPPPSSAPATPAPSTPAPTPAPTPQAAPFTAADLKPVFFDFDASTLTDAARAVLDANARLLRDNASAGVTIEGHCDERGTDEYNQALGERRAQAARDYLISAGIAQTRLSVISYGKERPFADGHDESAWAQNRRAQFVLR